MPKNMPRGTKLTEDEQRQILVLNAQSRSMREIASAINRSKTVVQAFLNNPDGYGNAGRPGRPRVLTPAERRIIKREVSKSIKSANDVRKELHLTVSLSTVQRALREDPDLKYKKMKASPPLTERHKNARVEFAKSYVQWTWALWTKVIFSDEKKFNLDGPDGFSYYWHDLRKEEKVFSKRQMGGQSIMTWGAFCFHGKSELAIVDGRQDSTKYCSLLEQYLIPFASSTYGEPYIFQQDNAPSHSSRQTKQWFEDKGIDFMRWPAKSPDLNPIENLWGILARTVYKNARQFSNVEELKEVVMRAWEEIPPETLRNLVRTMPNRCIEVLAVQGQKTKY